MPHAIGVLRTGRPVGYRKPLISTRAASSDVNMSEALRRAQFPPLPALIARIADHFAAQRPEAQMTDAARLTVAVRVAGSAQQARPLLRQLPYPETGTTRGAYASRLRTSLAARPKPGTDEHVPGMSPARGGAR